MGWRRPAAALVATLALLTVPTPARAAAVCDNPPTAQPVAKGTPIEDQIYDPARLAPFATGRGVRVAVIDSGVDFTHPQLRNRVTRGADFLHGDNSGRQDCVGHGTAVASLISANPSPATGFRGLAPDALIVPIRLSEQAEIDGKAVGAHGTAAQFAEAIDLAVEQRVQVINLSLVMTANNPQVERAIERAIAAGVVVVAAVGNHGDAQGGNPKPFPASYDGVIGVGAVTPEGVRASYSQHGEYVDLVAIGDQVTVAAPAGGNRVERGTSFSTPFVAATAALIKQRFPGLTPAQVELRLTATADPAPGGARSDEYGFGLLNPYRALTQSLSPTAQQTPAAVVMHADDPAALALAARRDHAQRMALLFGAIGFGLVLLIGAVAIVVRRGRRRGWHPATPGTG